MGSITPSTEVAQPLITITPGLHTPTPIRVLFLDDMTERASELLTDTSERDAKITWAMTAQEAITCLKMEGPFEVICLDHDLADAHYPNPLYHDGDCGCEVAGALGVWVQSRAAQTLSGDLEEFLPPIPTAVLHSLNPAGVSRMEGILRDAGYPPTHIVIAPFGTFRFRERKAPTR